MTEGEGVSDYLLGGIFRANLEYTLPYQGILKMTKRKAEAWKQASHKGELLNYDISSHGNFRSRSTGHIKAVFRLRRYAIVTGIRVPWQDGATTLRVAPLVAHAFIGPRPEGHQVDHIDGDRFNDYFENLRYLTQSDNIKHSYAMGKRKDRAYISLSPRSYEIINNLWGQGISQRDISRMTGVCNTQISKIVNGKCRPKPVAKRFLKDITVDWSARLDKGTLSRKLTAEKAVVIYLSTDPVGALAEQYGVSRGLIYGIRNGRFWANATEPYRLMP